MSVIQQYEGIETKVEAKEEEEEKEVFDKIYLENGINNGGLSVKPENAEVNEQPQVCPLAIKAKEEDEEVRVCPPQPLVIIVSEKPAAPSKLPIPPLKNNKPRKKKKSCGSFLKKKELDRARNKTRVNIGPAYQRWRELRDSQGFKTDAELAKVLLDSVSAEICEDNKQSVTGCI